MVRAGAMRHQIVIQSQSATQDAYGEQTQTWSAFVTQRASMDRTPGSEVWASAQRNARVPVIFRTRYVAGVTPGMRLIFDGRVHNIKSAVDQEGLKEELVLQVEELVGETP